VLLRQALSNLVRNALEACAGAGIAPVVVLRGAVDHTGRTLRIAVVDNGPGIDPSMRERVFRPFVTTRPDGTGLGLALVQKIVVTHNGRVQAQAVPGGSGTSMQIVLPLAASRAVRVPAPYRHRSQTPVRSPHGCQFCYRW